MNLAPYKPGNDDRTQPQGATRESYADAGADTGLKLDAVRSVRLHPALAISVAAVVLVAVVGYAMLLKPVYQATSQVYEEPASGQLLTPGAAPTFDGGRYELFLGEQMQMVQRLDVIKAALATLPRNTWSEYGPTQQVAAENLQKLLTVQRVATGYQLSIGLKGKDPMATADVVNAITTQYLETVNKTAASESDRRGQMLGEERQRIEIELQSARAEQRALSASIGVASASGENGNPYDAESAGIRTQLTEARAAHDVAAAQLATLSGGGTARNSGLTAAAEEAIAVDPGLSSMKASVSQRETQLNQQMAGMTPTNPIYRQDQDEIADLNRSLEKMTVELRDKAARRLQDKLRTDLERTGDVEARLNGALNRQIGKATSAAPRLQRAVEVAADLTRLQAREAQVDDALRGLRLETSGPAQVRLSLAATPAERPEPSAKKKLLLAAIPLALLCGLAAAVLARRRGRRIYSGMDVEDALGFPPLAILPARGEVSERVFEEYVLRLAAAVEGAHRNNGARTFLLTAVSASTDIEPLATALTRKFKEIGVNVLVATAPQMLVHRPLAPADGGPEIERWREGFVAANMGRMKTEHALVLIESEPLLNSAHTEYVARSADTTLLVIECGVTTGHELAQAAALLKRLHVTGVGAVLEEVQLRFADAGFRQQIEALDRRPSQAVFGEVRGPVVPGLAERAVDLEPAMAVPEAIAPDEEMLHAVRLDEPVIIDEPVAAQPVVPEPVVLEPVVPDPVISEPLPLWTAPPVAEPVHFQPEVIAEPAVAETEQSLEENRVAPATIRRGFAKRPTVLRAVAVENAATGTDPVVDRLPEKVYTEPAITVQNSSLREKMAPKLSARRADPLPDGEAKMERTVSWLDRLLGRNKEAAYSIVPDREETQRLTTEAPPAARVALRDEQNEDVFEYEDDPADEEALRSPPVAPLHHQISFDTTRLHIVPEDAAAIDMQVVAAEYAEAVSDFPQATEFPPEPEAARPEPVADQPEASEAVMSAVAGDRSMESRLASAPEVEPALAAAPPPVRPVEVQGPRRPFSFQELTAMARQAPIAGSDAAETLLPQEHFAVATADVQPLSIEQAAPAPIGPDVEEIAEFVPAAPERLAPELAAPVAYESVAYESVAYEPVAYEEVEQPVAAPVMQPARAAKAAPEAWPDFGEMSSPSIKVYTPSLDEGARQTERERDDVGPAYEAASRHLRTGRWDPIPPLRSAGNGWRDRPSPVPPASLGASVDAAHRQWTGAADDELSAILSNGRIAETETNTAEPTEHVLTRQWGLLSRFQQARIKTPGSDFDADAEPVAPGGTHANRQG